MLPILLPALAIWDSVSSRAEAYVTDHSLLVSGIGILLVLAAFGLWTVFPRLHAEYHCFMNERRYWKMQAKWGRMLSKRAKDFLMGDRWMSAVDEACAKGEINRHDKYLYKRLLANMLKLQDFLPIVRHPQQVKNEIQARRAGETVRRDKKVPLSDPSPLPDVVDNGNVIKITNGKKMKKLSA